MNQNNSVFHYSKNYGSLMHVTRSKAAVNMVDLTCLLGDTYHLNKIDVLRGHNWVHFARRPQCTLP